MMMSSKWLTLFISAALLLLYLMRDCNTFRSSKQIIYSVSLQIIQNIVDLFDKICCLSITQFTSVFLKPLLETGLVVIKHGINFEQTRAYIDIVLQPVSSERDQIVVSIAAMRVQLFCYFFSIELLDDLLEYKLLFGLFVLNDCHFTAFVQIRHKTPDQLVFSLQRRFMFALGRPHTLRFLYF